MKGSASQAQEQVTFGCERFFWRRVIAYPVAVVKNMGSPIDVLAGSIVDVGIHGVTESAGI